MLLNQIMEMVPRPATLEEAGDRFAYLASDQASYVTGQSILLDYGATLRSETEPACRSRRTQDIRREHNPKITPTSE